MANTTSPTLDAPAEPSQTSTVDQHDNALPHTVTAQLSSTPSHNSPSLQEMSLSTIPLLLPRLQRLEYLLTGQTDQNGTPQLAPSSMAISDGPQRFRHEDTVAARLYRLEEEVNRLRHLDGAVGDCVQEIEKLYARHPELFPSAQPSFTVSSRNLEADLSTLASIVTSHATFYPTAASQLTSLSTLPIPPAAQSLRLIELQPRIERARERQGRMERDIANVRERSAKLLEWWVRVGIVGMDDMWEEWEDRVSKVQREVGRIERRRKEEEGYS
jgi:hypothetical protein